MKTSAGIIVTVLLFAGLLVLSAKAEDKKMAGFFHQAGEKAVKEGNDEEAIKQFRMALKCDPNHSGAVFALAQVYARKLEPTSVTDLYKTWLDAMKNVRNPGKEQRAAAKKIKYEMRILTKLVEIEKKYAKKFAALGQSLKGHDNPKAIECYGIAIKLDPKNSAIARVYKRLTGDKAKATADDSEIEKLEGIRIVKQLAFEDFTAKTAGWPQSSKAYCKDGRYLVKAGTRRINIYYRQNNKTKNFYAECEAQFVSDKAEEASAGMCFRVLDSRNYYLFLVSTSGKFGVWVVKDGIKTDLTGAEEHTSPAEFKCFKPSSEIGKWTSKNIISVAMIKEEILCYVNRKLVYSCTNDQIYSGGQIGYCVNGGNSLYAFDNFKIYSAILPR
ncbi:MAG: hypothetical protein E3J72_04680 [Planctomycetota bacterium]|nr:MAG: hypothetical protein E3J72_04680 [Planctomycetota bacterium]